MARPDPYQRLRLRAWDAATAATARGTSPTDLPAAVRDSLSAEIDAAAAAAVPAHGRSFRVSLAKSMCWGVAVVVLLMVFGPSGQGSLPLLLPGLVIAVLVWAAAFGTFAARHKVQLDRVRATLTARAVIERTVARVVSGEGDQGDKAWSVRLRARPGEVDGFVVDGSLAALRQSLAARGPVALFVREPGTFADSARLAADRCGIALFVVTGRDLLPMSRLATAALDAAEAVPVLRDGWAAAASARGVEK